MAAESIDGETLVAIECMDGRPGAALRKKAQKKLGINRVDSVSAPGVVKDVVAITPEWVKERIAIAQHHGARRLWIVAHEECAGNPIDRVKQEGQIRAATARLHEEYPGMKIKGFFSRRKESGKGWNLKRVR